SLARKQVDALLVGPSPLANNRRVQLVTLAAYHRVLAIYFLREFAEVGGLMSYGTSIADANRLAGVYTGRILKGEKPGELPVMQSTKFAAGSSRCSAARWHGRSWRARSPRPPGCLASPCRCSS